MSRRKNNGKTFENNFKDSMPSHVWAYRPPDSGGGMMARFTQESICDLFVYDTTSKDLKLVELKSTVGTSVSFKDYETCMAYETAQAEFTEYFENLSAQERSETKEANAERRKELNLMRRDTNQGMIKYHQVKTLLETEEEYGIKGYLAITFISVSSTYLIPIRSFVEFWKETTKKSINEKDMLELVSNGKAYVIPQENIGRSKINFTYDVTPLLEN